MTGPLEGINVLDISGGAAGPIAGALLGELGADVIKVEAPWGDFVRNRPPYKNGIDLMAVAFSRSKRSIVLDLKKEKDWSIMTDLVKWADIFLENFKGGAADKMGLSYENLRSINPKIIYASSGSFGHRGPLKEKSTMANTSAIFAGWGSISGPPGGPGEIPMGIGMSADSMNPTYLTMDILMALCHRELTSQGQKIETAQVLTSIALQQTRAGFYFSSGEQSQPMGSASPHVVPSQAFETKDTYLVVEAPTERTWRRLCEALGAQDLLTDARLTSNALRVENREALIPRLEAIFREKTASQWIAILKEHAVPCALVSRTLDDIYADPQVQANSLVFEIERPKVGWLKTAQVPWQFSKTPVKVKSLGPLLGEHSKEIREQFGFPPEDDRVLAEARSARLAGHR